MERITSRQNAKFKQARKLIASSRERSKSRQTLIDGTRLISAYAEQFGLQDATLFISEPRLVRPEVRQIVDSLSPQRVHLLADELFAEIAQVESSEGIAAVVGIPRVESKPPDEFQLLLDGIQDPGNVGGLLRTAAAAGVTSAHLAKGCADVWSPKSLRGGMGAQFTLAVRERVDLQATVAGFRGQIFATSPRATKSIYEMDMSGPVALLFGGEGRGLKDEVAALAHQLVYIPMAGKVESLNVAAAAAICCFERLRQVRIAVL